MKFINKLSIFFLVSTSSFFEGSVYDLEAVASFKVTDKGREEFKAEIKKCNQSKM